MEESESAVVDFGKDHIDPESLTSKRWEDEEKLDTIQHLFNTGEDKDKPIAKANMVNKTLTTTGTTPMTQTVASRKPRVTNPIRSRLSCCRPTKMEALKRKFEPNTTIPDPPISTSTLNKTLK